MSKFKSKMVRCDSAKCIYNKDAVCTRSYIYLNHNGTCIYNDSHLKNIKKEGIKK